MESLDDELPKDATAWQQFFYERFGDRDWDRYNLNQQHLLKRMIGFAIYGTPTELGDDKEEIGYGKKANEHIQNIYDLIWKNHYIEDSTEILLRIIFISCEFHDKKKPLVCKPLFVIKKCGYLSDETESENFFLYDNCNVFIDDSPRVYESWKNYLTDNKLPKCKMYCPANGQYKGEIINDECVKEEDLELRVILEIHDSPACSTGRKFLVGSDRAKTAVSIGSTATFIAAAIPGVIIAPPLIAAAAVGGLAVGAYSVGRSIADLRDRKKHKQSISLADPDARSSWIDAGVGVLGASSSAAGIVVTAATSGANISTAAAQVTYNALNVATMVGTTTSFIFSGYNIYEKLSNNLTPTSLEIFQFAVSVLFFHKSDVSFKTARNILSETQSSTLKEYGRTLRTNRYRKLVQKVRFESCKADITKSDNTEIISGIQSINDSNNFFSGLAKINKQLNSSPERYIITEDDNVLLKDAYILDRSTISTIKENKQDISNPLSPSKSPSSPNSPKSVPKTVLSITDFTRKHCTVLTYVDQYLNKYQSNLNDIEHWFSDPRDLEAIALLLQEYNDNIVSDIIVLLLKFMPNLTPELSDSFNTLYPFVSIIVGALQYLLKYIENLAEDADISFVNILQTFFDHDKSVNGTFVKQFYNGFKEWIELKVEEINKIFNNSELDKVPKKKETCTICQGNYFVFN